MWRSATRYLIATALVAWVGYAGITQACGPFLDESILALRAQRLLELHEGGFASEMRRLAGDLADDLPVVPKTDDSDRDRAEQRDLSPPEIEALSAARAQPDGDAAYAAGAPLPPAARLYVAGAVAFHAGNYEQAVSWFEKILQLDAADRAPREVWANFMIGRCGRFVADLYERSRAAFARTRELVRGGADDPLGLAAASLGEEARLCLEHDAGAAVALYLEQARYAGTNAIESLSLVNNRAFRDPNVMSQLINSPAGLRLLIVSFFTSHAMPTGTDQARALELRLKERPATDLEDADRAAAALYRRGEYDLAGNFAARTDTALAHWVRAKLAVRAADLDQARTEFAAAIERFRPHETWDDTPGAFEEMDIDSVNPRQLAVGDAAVLATARGEFVDALRLFMSAGKTYWYDAAYLAERILTAGELKSYVDQEVPATTSLPAPANEEASPPWDVDAPSALRHLLARRLMRTGEFEAALPYFDSPEDRAAAEQYGRSMRAADRTTSIDKAGHLWDAAAALHSAGMEIVGFELYPDYAMYDGSYQLGLETSPRGTSLATAAELSRSANSSPGEQPRYHYRFAASTAAQRAANLVPARSQAYAALLCHATRWIIDMDPQHAQEIYRRYVRNGALVPFGATFGRQCPAPDFDRARKLQQQQRQRLYQRIGAGIGIALVVGSLVLVLRRRRATKQASS